MATDPADIAIVRLYVERGARRYHAILPQPAVEFFSETLPEVYPYGNDKGLLDALRPPRGPRREPPVPASEPPRLPEEHERTLDAMQFTPEMKRQVREAIADGLIERAADSASRSIDWLAEQVDAATFDRILDACEHADPRVAYHTLPAGPDREACDRSVTRWVDISFASFFADLMVVLAQPGDLGGGRIFFPAVHTFRGASRRLLPGDRAIFATYHRDHEGFLVVAAQRNVTRDEERARYEGFLERLAAAIEEEAQKVQATATLAEVQEALAWLAAWVGGQLDERSLH